MNIPKLRKLKKFILAEPRRYNQNTWFTKCGPFVDEQKPPCGTVCCLAGAACLMEGFNYKEMLFADQNTIGQDAAKILGLAKDEAMHFFGADGTGWHPKAHSLYVEAKTVEDRAKAAALAIDLLICSGRKPRKAKQ